MANYYKLIGDYPDATGIMPLLYSIRDAVTGGYTIMLFTIFFVLGFGNYFFNKGKTGRGRIMMSLFASSIVTLILGMFLLLAQLISLKIVAFIALITIGLFIFIVLSDKT